MVTSTLGYSQLQPRTRPLIIVCGMGRTGSKIFHLLRRQGADVVGISEHPMPEEDGARIVVGDPRCPATLTAAGIRDATTLLLALSDDALNLGVLTQARVLNPDVRIVNRLFNQALGDRLDKTLPGHVSTSVAALSAPIFAFAAIGHRAIGQLQLFGRCWPVREETINADHPWLGRPLSELWDNRSRMLIGFFPVGDTQGPIEGITRKRRLRQGDRLLVGTQPVVPDSRQARWRKLLKAISHLRRFHHHAGPVVSVMAMLLLTIFLSAVTYVVATDRLPFVDALYFTVGMITGAGGREQVAETSTSAIKVFTVVMMLVGAGVIGVCYALINDFILGNRLKQFWDAARVPARHHYIVCGLGGIGIQIVRQLHEQGCEVVAIERDLDGRFLHAARALGVPVIVADASLTSTLEAANVRHAAALLAVTSNDMVNVEISLTAKAIHSQLHAIVRHQDSDFARSVQEVFSFETVLCPSDIAAPSFAAAALGGRAIGNGLIDDLLWVAIATEIAPDHPFCDREVQAAALDVGGVPLYLKTPEGTVHGWQLLYTQLAPGHVLYITLPAAKLDQLWHLQPSLLTA
ncbi:Kef-type K+ transport system, predicted NAD-binding component [Rubidibacter lacunae KORDI 51-2]|uniref:Kef-type K+ transport system, predicted NAD-binding component n=1 Tax=Rubidibacter lacunae KORDI 51-2 TaxID=582515 RepID=U5DP81_9CHRO|nr:NAD-binding protein [Rubidibacter lacunae]ERN42419.1 Kef-type K+ transport system, predicted NAD-binding component [Rubidibacter lacunae KORDI 51-2]